VPEIDWVEIPGGEFHYGHEDESDNPSQILILPTFHIARYPVTFAQFQCFIDAADVDDDRWWAGMPEEVEAFGTVYRVREFGNQAFKYPNHPRETVSWYQAVAYTRWLSDKLGYLIALPTEEQWEKAARGTDGRRYPYGDAYDPMKGNTNDTNIGQTSAVGIFLAGASPYGVLDLSGNVFEWCLNHDDEPDQTGVDASGAGRVLRGGSWDDDLDFARAAYHYGGDPDNRLSYVGFRLCRPPSRQP
jgi:formylglycine-generating enzyme required for sulfatase activity